MQVVEDRGPLWGLSRCSGVPGHGDRILDPGVSGVVVDDLQLPLGRGVVEASLQGVEEVLVEEFKLNGDAYAL